MRELLTEKMPMLSSRIRRLPESEEEGEVTRQAQVFSDGVDPTWKWEDAEERLRVAYDQGGFSGWAEAALKELEAERKLEHENHLLKGNKTI